ncbi:MAG: ComE-like competence protein [Firmicutes bacterium]|nr:ComE-like competence protein [Bacillota bacterium]
MRPALWMAAALTVGIAVAAWLRPHPALALAAVVMCGLWAAMARRRAALALLACLGALGAFRYAYAQTAGRGDLAAWEGRKAAIVGTVSAEPELRQPRGVGYILAVEQVDGHPARGLLYVTQWGAVAPGYGERVAVTGTLKAPAGARTPGGFDRAAYLARQGVYFTLDSNDARRMGPGALNPVRRAAVAVRVRLEGVLRATLPQRDASLMAGLLFGSRSELPEDIREAFRASGVFHLLAVSGGNVAMVIMPVLLLLRRVGMHRRIAAAVAIPLVIFFIFLTGASPSVVRAGLMAVLMLLGAVLRREKNAVNTLGAAVAMLLLVNPVTLFDVGFQLSVLATLGILLFARPIEGWLTPHFQAFAGEKAGSWLAAGLSVTFAAQIMVEPISLHTFGAFSAIAPVANLLVLAFLEPVVQLGSVSALVGLLLVPAARVFNLLVRVGLWALVFLVKATASVPFAYVAVGRLPAGWMVAWYAVLACVAVPVVRESLLANAGRVRAWWAEGHGATRRSVAALLALVIAGGCTWRLALAEPPDTLSVTFLDVGQGDAILIQAPNGESMLVDSGGFVPADARTGRPGYDAGAEVVLPLLADKGIKRLDYLVLTHPDTDHAGGGAAILHAMPVGTLLKSDDHPTEKRYLAAMKLADEQGVRIGSPVAGDRLNLGPEVVLEILSPPAPRYAGTRSDDNANCVAFRLRYRQIAMIFACDLEGETEEQLVARGVSLNADLLKAAHHGSGYSSTGPFLQAVRPRFAVLSVGAGNRYGHPHQDTLQRLKQVGAQVYRTDRHGSVEARTDGFTLSVAGERGGPADDQYRPVGLLGRRWLFAW